MEHISRNKTSKKCFAIKILLFTLVTIILLSVLLLSILHYFVYCDKNNTISEFTNQINNFNVAIEILETEYSDESSLTLFYSHNRDFSSSLSDDLYNALDNINKNFNINPNYTFNRVTIGENKIIFGFDGNPIAFVYSQDGKRPHFLEGFHRTKIDDNWYYFYN